MAQITPAEPEPVTVTPQVPQALEAEPLEIPIDDPSTQPPVEIETPVEEPEPEPEQKQPLVVQTSEEPVSGSLDGETEVDVPVDAAFSGARVDNASFRYPFWFTLTWAKISQNFRIPIAFDGKLYTDIYFQVIKSGRVIELKVVKSSGITTFDDACLAAIERAAPFPPLPRDFLDEIIGITITFTN